MLKATDIYPIISSYFPKINDCYQSEYTDELTELKHFGIQTKRDLINLIKRNITEVLQKDKEASILCEEERKWLSKEMGEQEVQTRIDNGFWFSYPALLRLTLEIENGDTYTKFAEERDKIS